ncbi:MAG: hypothetical protein PHU12_00330 [Candidatus Aenigmarchaeota archaeon]|nr:hypothetical protein [Candidatus Aenigmarchaeota archaeon]
MGSIKQYAKEFSTGILTGLDVLGVVGENYICKELENGYTIGSQGLKHIAKSVEERFEEVDDYKIEGLPLFAGFLSGATISLITFGIPSYFLATLDGAYNSVRLARKSFSKNDGNVEAALI